MSSQTATILVTDLVGSTELRARLGEEQAERLRRVHDRLQRAAVEAHGGTVVKGLGDGVLASFSQASGAAAAAVAIQQAAEAHTRNHPDLPLVLRVGLSAGDVTVEEDGDCFGTPVIEASRLCGAAEPGRILAADLVRLLARGRGGHEFTTAGEFDLKGLAEPVTAVEIGWRQGDAGASRLPFPELLAFGGGLGFAGRASELELLTTAWKEAAAGERRRVVLGGEPGVGKTRLAAEIARRVQDAGGSVLYGRCEEDLGVPYAPFVEALTFFCERTPPDELPLRLGRYPGELSRLLPELRDLVPGLEPPLRSDPETEQYRLFEAVGSWLAAAGEASGLLLVVDDLHWAPPPTLQLLAHVLRAAGPARLLVVGTFRDTEIGPTHPLTTVLGDLRRSTEVERLSLQGLSVDELSELLEDLPRSQSGRALAATLHEGTEGNPFFVGEILRHISESGMEADALPVPEGVREVTVARVARLAPATRQLLGACSVLGRNFELGSLAAIVGVNEDGAIEALDEALAARLVEETGIGRYRFIHDLVRSALYDTLSVTRRARLHLRAADVFEQEGGDDDARLARHLIACAPLGGTNRTAAACLAAGDRAFSVLADGEAANWYAHGLAFVNDEDDPQLRIDLLIGLGEAQRRTGDSSSRETLLGAARLAAAHGEVARLVRAVLANNRGVVSVVGEVDEERLELISAALDLVGPGASGDRSELLSVQALELVFAGDHERVLRAADEAGAIASGLDDATVRARVGMRCLWASLVPERITALAAEGADVVRLADASGDPQLRAWSRALWGHCLLLTGDLGEARRQAEEAMATADETRQPGQRCLTHIFYATAIDAVGDHEEAERLSQGVLELGQEAGFADATAWYFARISTHWMFEGQAETAAILAAQAFAHHPRLVVWQALQALDLALAGRGEELAGLLAGLPAVLPGVPVDLLWLAAHFCFAAAQGFGVENPEAAAVTYERLLPYRSLHGAGGVVVYLGPVEMALAVAARVMGDIDAALGHHQAAAATIEACGAARARAFNGYQWAVTLLARDGPGDHQQAVEMLKETLAYCRTKGYTTFTGKAEGLLATVG